MGKIEELINKLCPNGVEFVKLKDIAELRGGTPLSKENSINGEIPVISSAKKPSFYHKEWNRAANTITVASSGEAGFVNFWDTPIFCADCFSITSNNYKNASIKYIYYFLKTKQEDIYKLRKGGGQKHVYPKDLADILIPLPPIKIQNEIVHILDTFTELITELITELKHRKIQYQYYLDNIFLCLSDSDSKECNTKFSKLIKQLCPNGVEFVKLNDISELKKGTPLKEENKIYGNVPVISSAKKASFYHNEPNRTANIITVASSGEAGFVNFWNVPIFCADCFSIISNKEYALTKYIYYYLKNIQEDIYKLRKGGGQKHVYPSDLEELNIPLPPIEIQNEIVNVLDQFNDLTNSISLGLPKEIELRKQQYEYYINKLLTFKQLEK